MSGLTALALVGFAANSLFCRQALTLPGEDPVVFTALRLGSGALVLALLTGRRGWRGGRASQATALFAYAIAFSLAYVQLDAGVGALLLFASVQLTMFGWTALRGAARPTALEWVGMVVALRGLAWLLRPGGGALPLDAAALMVGAGVAWGTYTLLGVGTADPLGTTAGNFLYSLPLVGFAMLVQVVRTGASVSGEGALYAVLSGALASGLGYACWYAALRSLRPVRAAVLQLTVPVIAALGGIAFLSETMTTHLLVSGAWILAGVAVALWGRRRPG